MKFALLSLSSLLIPLIAASPIVSVDIRVTDDALVKSSPDTTRYVKHGLDLQHGMSLEPLAEQIPGWMFFNSKRIQARIHGNTFWNIKGELEKPFPIDEFLFDPLIFTLSHPMDFEGDFTGTIGKGEISLKWEKSGATIKGRSPIGDYEVKGKTVIDWSP